MKKHYILLSLATSLLANTSVAATPSDNWTWVYSVSAGPAWARGGESQTFYLAPEIEKTYAANNSYNTIGIGEIFVGVQQALSSPWLGQVGLAVATTSNAQLQGDIWDDADPQFDNYNYQYKINHTSVAVKGKLIMDTDAWVMPWVSASLGVGFNDAHAFTNNPTIYEAVANPDFASHTETAFTYTLGVGVQKAFNSHWVAGIGYEFADWGKSQLGRANGQTENSGLSLDHLYTNELLFNVTYLP